MFENIYCCTPSYWSHFLNQLCFIAFVFRVIHSFSSVFITRTWHKTGNKPFNQWQITIRPTTGRETVRAVTIRQERSTGSGLDGEAGGRGWCPDPGGDGRPWGGAGPSWPGLAAAAAPSASGGAWKPPLVGRVSGRQRLWGLRLPLRTEAAAAKPGLGDCVPPECPGHLWQLCCSDVLGQVGKGEQPGRIRQGEGTSAFWPGAAESAHRSDQPPGQGRGDQAKTAAD